MELGGWLRNLGLGQYESAFIENAIDTDVLPELTEGDLEKLGIPLGHRRKMLRAIAELDRATLAPAGTATEPVRPEEAEHAT